MLRRVVSHWGSVAALLMAVAASCLFVPRDANAAQGGRNAGLVNPVAGDPSFKSSFGSAVDEWASGPEGGYFIARLNGIVERHAANGALQWTFDLDSGAKGLDIDVSSIAVSPSNELFLLGLAQSVPREQPRMILASVATRKGVPSFDILRTYDGMEPAGLATSRDGRIYLVAMEVRRVNELLGCGEADKSTLKPFEEPFLYEANNVGELIRPILSAAFDPSKPEAVDNWTNRFWETRIALDTSDNVYLYRLGEPLLEKIDVEAGRVIGKMTLPQSGFWNSVRVDGIQFVDLERVLYTLQRVGEDDVFLGSETRTLDIADGESIGLGDQASSRPHFALYDRTSQEFRAVPLVGPGSPRRLEAPTGFRYPTRLR